VLLAGIGIVTSGLVLAAVAFACSPAANVNVSPEVAAVGSTVTLSGSLFLDGRPVALSIDGQTVATATGPGFSVPVTLPQLDAGVHLVRAQTTSADGTPFAAVATVEITPSTSPAADAPTGAPAGAPDGGAAGVGDSSGGGSAAPAAATTAAPLAGGPARSVSPARSTQTARTPARAPHTASRASHAAKRPASPARSAAVVEQHGRAVFPTSPASSSAPVRSTARGAATRRTAQPVRSASPKRQPVGSGVSQAKPTLPSLTSSAGSAQRTDAFGPLVAIGVGLLGLGLVLLLGGFVLADARRRRVRAGATRDR
jgi:hypothetical protein